MKPIEIVATVNVAETIRRGKPTAVSSVRIPLAELVAAVPQEHRNTLADAICRRSDGDYVVRNMATEYPVAMIPTADAAGLAEAFVASIERKRQIEAEEAERKRKKEVEDAELVEAIRARPLIAVEIPNAVLDRDYSDVLTAAQRLGAGCFAGGAKRRYHLPTLPEDVAASVDALIAAINSDSKAIADDRKRKAYAAQLARLLPHLDAEERDMHDRGYLSLSDVEKRLDEEATEALREKIEPPGYALKIDHRREDSGAFTPGGVSAPATKEEWRTLRRLEHLTGQRVRRVKLSSYVDDVAFQTEITTADGRTLTVTIQPEE